MTKLKKSFFISVEGIDGAGKSTHIPFIKKHLEAQGINVVLAREPGGTECGEKIRKILLHEGKISHITELFLMFASRQELLSEVVVPNLNAGNCVVVDRFIDATIAYQGGGRGIPLAQIESLAKVLNPQIKTDLTLLFDIDLNTANYRVGNNKAPDRIEQEDSNFFANVQQAYHTIAKNEPRRVKLINTANPISETQQLIRKYLDHLIKKALK